MRTKSDTTLPAHVRWNTNRHGKRKLVHKKGRHGKLTTFKCQQPGTDEFWKEYHQIGLGVDAATPDKRPVNFHYAIKFKVLVERYLASPEFERLMKTTQYDTRWGLNAMMECAVPEQGKPRAEWFRLGECSIDTITSEHLRAARHNIAPPEMKCRTGNSDARMDKMIAKTKALYTWANINGWPKLENPCVQIDKLAPKSKGHIAWNEKHVAQFIGYHHKGSMAYLTLCLLRFLGVRACDAISLGKEQITETIDRATGKPVSLLVFTEYKNSTSRTRKTEPKVRVYPIAPELWEAIEVTPGALRRPTFLANPQTLDRFSRTGNFARRFRGWCDAAGMPKNLSAHGVRKFVAIDAAHKGHSASTLKAILGHTGLRQSEWYVAQAEELGLLTTAVSGMTLPKPAPGLKVAA